MIVADLAPLVLKQCLRSGDLRLRTGPVVFRIRSRLTAVQRGIWLKYSQHTVEPHEAFSDFHVSVERPSVLDPWSAKHAVFQLDGLPPFKALPRARDFAMLEAGLNWCMFEHCHQYLIVRAAVLERGGRALILPAPPRSGKSTLCAGLAFGGGWRMLSDELALIDLASGRVVPLPRPLSLKNDSIDAIGKLAPTVRLNDVVHDTVDGRISYAAPPANAVLRANEQALPAWVVLPRYRDDAADAAQLHPLSRARAFMALVDNALNYAVHGRAGFTAFARVIDRCACYEIDYRSLPEAVSVFDRLSRTAP